MFTLYKTKDLQLKDKMYYKNLNILRLDCTEKNLFDYRFVNDDLKNINKILEDNFKKNNIKILKNIAFISNDFSLKRPSGMLCKDFFHNLLKFESKLSIFLISKFKIKYPFSQHKNNFYSTDNDSIEQYIKENNIDILIDMQGHMPNNYNELLSKRLAPIQIHFLGYPGTTGLSCIDYLIADKTIIPTESCIFYREKIAYLPNCYQANSESYLINKKKNNTNIFKFCNFNCHYKFDKKQIFVWIDILKKVPNSVLYLISFKYKKIISTYADYNDIKNRIIFLDVIPHKKHLQRISKMDLGLDSYRVNGHTTTSDLICSGVPLITYSSDTYHNRVSKSILKSLNLDELVCYSYKEYIDLAVKIATNKKYYNEITNKIKYFRTKTLFHSSLYTKNFINLLFNIWDHHYKNFTKKNQFSITNFGHNKKNQNYKWNYLPYIKIKPIYFNLFLKKFLIKKVHYRGQILRDIADNNNNCSLFTTSGLLFNCNLFFNIKILNRSNNYSDGIWYKTYYTDNYIENLDLQNYNTINKDYNLPQVLIIFKYDDKSNLKIIEYANYQSYLNIKLIFHVCNDKSNLKKIKSLKFNNEINDYEIIATEKINNFIEEKKNTYKLIINNSNINNVLNNFNYIQENIVNNPSNFTII